MLTQLYSITYTMGVEKTYRCWLIIMNQHEPTHYGCLPIVGVSLPFRWFATHQYGLIPNLCLFQRGLSTHHSGLSSQSMVNLIFSLIFRLFFWHGSVSPESKCRGLLCIPLPSTHLNKLWGRPWMGLKWAKHAQSFSRSTQTRFI
jgi:hypothetical protein